MEIIRDLRAGKFDVLVGINLLREGLDMPEVSLVAILDADKEGFLRSTRSLIQTIGRAARNVNGKAILYADSVTASMARALEETDRRRSKQTAHNAEHGITPQTVRKQVKDIIEGVTVDRWGRRYRYRDDNAEAAVAEVQAEFDVSDPRNVGRILKKLEKQMYEHAKNLEFEEAARLRDKIQALRSGAFGAQRKAS